MLNEVELVVLLGLVLVAPFVAQDDPRLASHVLAVDACCGLFLARLWRPHDATWGTLLTAFWPGVWACLALVVLARGTRRCCWVVLAAFALYAAGVARWGWHLRVLWPWPVLLPQLAGVLVAWLAWLRRELVPARSGAAWAQVGTVVLPASAMADVVTVWAGAPDGVRALLGAVTWVFYAVTLVGARCVGVADGEGPPSARRRGQ